MQKGRSVVLYSHQTPQRLCDFVVMRTSAGLFWYNDMKIKPAKTFEEQVDILINEHGLIVEDRKKAIETLRRINYYHLRGYYIHWMDNAQKRFNPGITFEMICSLQQFDTDLRCLLMPYLQKIELSFRTAIAYHIATVHGPMEHLNENIYTDRQYFQDFRAKLKKEVEESRELFIKHHGNDVEATPIWACIEILSFGSVAFMYKNLVLKDRQDIAKTFYGVDERILCSYINAMPYLRNVCAHCGRLYAKWLTSPIRIKEGTQEIVRKYSGEGFTIRPNLLFAYFLAMRDLLTGTEWQSMTNELNALFQKYSHIVEPIRLGFPRRWVDIAEELYKQSCILDT